MRKDLLLSAGLLCIAVLYYVGATGIQTSTLEDGVGPRGLPNVLAILLGFVALVIGGRALLSAPQAKAGDTEAEAPWPRALGVLAIGALYIPLAMVLGYWLTLFLLLLAVSLYEGMRPSWQMGAVAIGGATFFWILFDYVLGVRQPDGILF